MHSDPVHLPPLPLLSIVGGGKEGRKEERKKERKRGVLVYRTGCVAPVRKPRAGFIAEIGGQEMAITKALAQRR